MTTKLTFEQWMQFVDAILDKRYGMTSDGMIDWCYRDDYEDGYLPQESARRAYNNALNS